MKRRATALIGAVMFGGLSAGAACSSSGGGQTAHGGSGGQPQGGVGGTAGSIGVGEETAHHALSGPFATKGQRHDDDTGVKCAH